MLVFQYGSNTSAARLNSKERLAGDALDLGLARTRENYELAFTVFSKKNDCAASDIRLGGDAHAWGVLYRISDDLVVMGGRPGRKSLDEIEGPKYERRPIEVVLADGSAPSEPVYTYTVREPAYHWKTSFDYVRHILLGLREHNAPPDYVERVKEIAITNNPDLKDALKQFKTSSGAS